MTLRVTLEIVPYGVEAQKRTIYTIDISNQSSQTKSGRTRYKALVTETPYKLIVESPILRLAHFREDGALRLAKMALEKAEKLLF